MRTWSISDEAARKCIEKRIPGIGKSGFPGGVGKEWISGWRCESRPASVTQGPLPRRSLYIFLFWSSPCLVKGPLISFSTEPGAVSWSRGDCAWWGAGGSFQLCSPPLSSGGQWAVLEGTQDILQSNYSLVTYCLMISHQLFYSSDSSFSRLPSRGKGPAYPRCFCASARNGPVARRNFQVGVGEERLSRPRMPII